MEETKKQNLKALEKNRRKGEGDQGNISFLPTEMGWIFVGAVLCPNVNINHKGIGYVMTNS